MIICVFISLGSPRRWSRHLFLDPPSPCAEMSRVDLLPLPEHLAFSLCFLFQGTALRSTQAGNSSIDVNSSPLSSRLWIHCQGLDPTSGHGLSGSLVFGVGAGDVEGGVGDSGAWSPCCGLWAVSRSPHKGGSLPLESFWSPSQPRPHSLLLPQEAQKMLWDEGRGGDRREGVPLLHPS